MYSRVYVEITNICNMQCSFCHGHHRPHGQMTTAQFNRVLDSLKGITSHIYYHLMGEPLMHPELFTFMKMAAQGGFHSMITTNGTLLQQKGEDLIKARPHKVNISLHSFERGGAEAHRQYLLTVADFARTAAEAGIIVVLRLWNQGIDDKRNDSVLTLLHQVFPCEWSPNNRGMKLQEKLFLEWGARFTWPDKDAHDGGADVSCYGMRDHFGILCDGTVVPCCLDSEGGIPLGNVFSRDLKEILSSSRAQAIKRGFECRRATEELCRRCSYARRF